MKLFVKKIEVDKLLNQEIKSTLENLETHKINHCNWEKEFPYQPKVEFKIAHNDENIYIHYFVEEKSIRAKATEDNGNVWEDSCCEFFISFDQLENYFNIETNCIGTKLVHYGKPFPNRSAVAANQLQLIKTESSLGKNSIETQEGEFKWDMLVQIPITALKEAGLCKLSGVKARANFYKCGDETKEAHFLSWNKIDLPNPNFHCPEFFGEVEFE